MKLSLKDRGLTVFDGETVVASSSAVLDKREGAPRTKPTATDIVALDLSHNHLEVLISARALRFLTELDVSHNHLVSLVSIPPTVKRLNIAHNKLTSLDGIQGLDSLAFLDFSNNQITDVDRHGDWPNSLTTIIASHNRLTTAKGFLRSQSLIKLHVDHNKIGHLDELVVLGGLRALRHISVNGNPVASNPRLLAALTNSLPKLTTLDGMTLSQAQANRMMIASTERQRSASRSRSSARGKASDVSSIGGISALGRSRQSSRWTKDDRDSDEEEDVDEVERHDQELRMRALEAKVKELRRLAAESDERETDLRKRNKQLREQMKRAIAVWEEQDFELERLRNDNDALGTKALSLQRTVNSLDNAFRSQHASVVYSRIYNRTSATASLNASIASNQKEDF